MPGLANVIDWHIEEYFPSGGDDSKHLWPWLVSLVVAVRAFRTVALIRGSLCASYCVFSASNLRLVRIRPKEYVRQLLLPGLVANPCAWGFCAAWWYIRDNLVPHPKWLVRSVVRAFGRNYHDW